jgi:formyltetrahydrofolate deformylase
MPGQTNPNENLARLLVSCADQPGIIAALANELMAADANIVNSAQFSTAPVGGAFFLRMEFHLGELADRLDEVRQRLSVVADRFAMELRVAPVAQRKRVAIFVSRYDHCLVDLLWRWKNGDLDMDLTTVVSNHADLEAAVAPFGVPYVHIPVTRETKREAERRELDLLAGSVDLVVMARYMQVLSSDFLAKLGAPVINIHHSFLPAFAGADPYARAHARGVKLIGATAHYATEDLDEGPIIEQEVSRVSHRHDPEYLAYIGRDAERIALARAVNWHLQDRVFVHERRTIVFN